MSPHTGHPSPRPLGFTIVEVMVAALIGLIGSIVIFQVFAVSEAQKRTTVGGGDAQQNGVLALFSIEREARMAGFGINNVGLLGCNVLAHDVGPPVRDFNFMMVPVSITDGAGSLPDSLTITYGNSDLVITPPKLFGTSTAASTVHTLNNRFGFKLGDLTITAESGSTNACSLGQVTLLPTAVGQTNQVHHNPGNYTNALGISVPARYNKLGGLGVDYKNWDTTSNTGGLLFNLGALPVSVTYFLQNTQLMQVNSLLGGATAATAIVDGVVQLQALYGKDADGDGDVDLWDVIMPVTAAGWSSIIALRIAIVARSSLPERVNPATGVCDATTVQPAWTGGALVINTDPNWQCHRYRVYETVVPMRNLIWMPPP